MPLLRTLKERRLIEPRLSGVSSHAPCRVDAGAPDLVPDAQCADPPRFGRRELESAERTRGPGEGDRSSEDLPASVLLGLVLDDDRKLKQAVERLEQIAAEHPEEARVHGDLAAAYLVRAEKTDAPLDLLRAYQAAEQALSLDGNLPEALFNRGIALERLFLVEEAGRSWEESLRIEDDLAWKEEARSRRDALRRAQAEELWNRARQQLEAAARAGDRKTIEAVVRRHRHAVREFAELAVLGEWAEAAAQEEGTVRAKERLDLARSIGTALVALQGDRLVRDAVAAIDAAAREEDPGRWRALVEGHGAFQRGYRLYDERKPGEAAVQLAAARDAFARAGSPFAARTRFFLACADHLADRHDLSLPTFRELDRELTDGAYPALLGQVLGMEALGQAVTGGLMAAVETYERSLAAFRSSGERESIAWTEALLAENLRLIGRDREAWEHAYRALRITPELRDPKILYFIDQVMADGALKEGAPELALLFYDRMVRLAGRSTPTLQAEALFWHGLVEHRLGRPERALEDLRQALRRIDDVEDAALHERRRADLALVEGTILLDKEPRAALPLLTSALRVYEQREHRPAVLRTLLARARAWRRSGDAVRAGADLEEGLRIYEQLGEGASSEDLRLAFLEETDAVFDEMIAFQAERQPVLAFAYADRARTRVLPKSTSQLVSSPGEHTRLLAAEPRPIGLAEMRRRLPRDTTIVAYSVLGARVLIWLIRSRDRGQEIPFFERAIRRGDLERLAGELRTVRWRGDGWIEASHQLFDLLVRPWISQAGKDELLVFVPDKVLHAVPFAALKDRATRRFLVEDHRIAVSPSATLYVNALAPGKSFQRIELAGDGRPRALVVGNPAFDSERFPLLLPLPHAEAEAARIARLRGATLLTGTAADKASFLAEAERADWIHFAGHSTVDERNSLLSALVLAPGADGDPGALPVRDIYPLRLPHTRLVVLAACDTGNAWIPGGEGVTTFARAFLAAGVPAVVASLWPVDDAATARLFEVFHRNLLDGKDPVSALRGAQLVYLASDAERSPAAWAAFEVFGASVP